METYGLDLEQVLQQIESEYQQSKTVVDNRRQIINDRLKLYNDQNKSGDKVQINMIFSTIRAMQAIQYQDQISVQFVPRGFEDAEKAAMLTQLAKFDFEEMGLDEIEYSKLRDAFFYGVGIRMFDGWDDIKQCPIVRDIDPRIWLPDPLGWKSAENFRWMGFEYRKTRREMEEEEFENIDAFNTADDQDTYTRNYSDGLGDNTEQNTNPDQIARYVLYHFTKVKGEKYMFAVNHSRNSIGKIIKLDKVLDTEKKQAMRPVTLTYFSPQRANPYGVSVVDLLEDKQRAKSILANLAIKYAKRSSLGGHRVYNKNLIKNRNDLAQLDEKPKLIGVELQPGTSLDSVITETKFNQLPNDNTVVQSMIDYEVRISTGVDPSTVGVSGGEAKTATESQQIQANANLLLGFTGKIISRSEVDFWTKWYKMYKIYKPKKKLIRVYNPIGLNSFEIKQNDFKTKADPDIYIKSKGQLEIENQKAVQALQLMIPFSQAQGGYGYIFAQRMLYEKLGFDAETTKILVPPTYEEMDATRQLELLNRNEDLEPITDIQADHDAYLAIYKQAIDTPAKFKAIQARLLAKMEKDVMMKQQAMQQGMQQQQGQEQQGGGMEGIANATANSMVNNNLQSSNKVLSLQQLQQ